MNNSRRFVIGDVHGCTMTLQRLLGTLKITDKDQIFFLGDLIDRGPRSKQTIDTIFALREKGVQARSILGNHEKMLLEATRSNSAHQAWMLNGGHKTLKSFGIKHILDLDSKYVDFFKSLSYFIKTDDFLLTHAGINNLINNPLTDSSAMLWTRSNEVDRKKIGGRRLISGHTPHLLPEIRASIHSDKIWLDGGCVYYKKYPGSGHLCAFEMNSSELTVQVNVDYDLI
ncbi:MAG: serine/threonine protein phosphatase [Chlorobi bacterium]|nr:serine/threonine protein phosphatase [Chlorobiota bacterium]